MPLSVRLIFYRRSQRKVIGLLHFISSLFGFLYPLRAQQPSPLPAINSELPGAPGEQGAQPGFSPGSITGIIIDIDGAYIVGARITFLFREGSINHNQNPSNQLAVSDSTGSFSFTNVSPGPFKSRH